MIKNRLLVLSLLALGALGAGAQTTTAPTAPAAAPAADSGSWVFTPSYASTYMFRGVRLGGPSFQPAIEFDKGSAAIGVWANFPIQDKVIGQSDPEFDLYGSYTIEAVKDTLTYAPGFTVYTYPNAKRANGFYKYSVEPNFAINYTVAGVKFTPKYYYDFILQGPTYELGVSYALTLAEGYELDFAGVYGHYQWNAAVPDVQPDLINKGTYWQAGVSFPYQVTKTSKITVGIALTEGKDNTYEAAGTGTGEAPNAAALRKTVFTFSYAITF